MLVKVPHPRPFLPFHPPLNMHPAFLRSVVIDSLAQPLLSMPQSLVDSTIDNLLAFSSKGCNRKLSAPSAPFDLLLTAASSTRRCPAALYKVRSNPAVSRSSPTLLSWPPLPPLLSFPLLQFSSSSRPHLPRCIRLRASLCGLMRLIQVLDRIEEYRGRVWMQNKCRSEWV